MRNFRSTRECFRRLWPDFPTYFKTRFDFERRATYGETTAFFENEIIASSLETEFYEFFAVISNTEMTNAMIG